MISLKRIQQNNVNSQHTRGGKAYLREVSEGIDGEKITSILIRTEMQ